MFLFWEPGAAISSDDTGGSENDSEKNSQSGLKKGEILAKSSEFPIAEQPTNRRVGPDKYVPARCAF